MAEHECEIASLYFELLFESDLSETEKTEFHRTIQLNFSEIEFLRFWNRDLPPIPTSQIFVSGLPEAEAVGWESDLYGKYFNTGPNPSIWRSDSSELCKLVQSRRKRIESIENVPAHYVVIEDRLQFEVFGALSVVARIGSAVDVVGI